MFGIMQLAPRVCSLIEEIFDRVPKDEWIARYHSAEGVKVRITVENTEVTMRIRDIASISGEPQ